MVEKPASKIRAVNADYTQGSVFGPLLGLIYLHDLDGTNESELFFIADDTISFKSHFLNSGTIREVPPEKNWTE